MPKSEGPSPGDVLRYSVEAVKRGDVHIGKRGLIWVVQKEPSNVTAWLWLAYVIEDGKAKIECYMRVLRLDPANETARKALAKYGAAPVQPTFVPTAEAPSRERSAISELAHIEVSAETKDSVASKLELARRDLLDLSLYNKLLNYRPLKAKGLEITGEKPEEVFRVLVSEGRAMSFLPTKKKEAQRTAPLFEGSDTHEAILDQPEEEEEADRFTDNKLQTPYLSEELQTRLLNTYFAAKTYVEEQGVNILFLALGMLRWYESDTSDDAKLAPLILVPVELNRSNVRAKFRIGYTEEEIGENLSLRAKLASDFGLKLPEFSEEDELRVQEYFKRVSTSISALRRWSVEHEAISLGFFSFGKFLMFHDLEQDEWPEEMLPAEHPILSRLLGDGFPDGGELLADDTDVDEILSPEDTLCVVDADSSQTLAILEANKGRNLVIQGPPGTGKSQTITNLIAEAIGRHKSVLFVAEKMAALEVVKRRLDNVGLGDACLELHSHKTNKKALLGELRRSLELGQPKPTSPMDFLEFRRNRDRLNGYSKAVNEKIGESQLTPFDVYGGLLRVNEALAARTPPHVEIPGIERWSRSRVEEALAVADELQVLLRRIGPPPSHPFWACDIGVFLPADEDRARTCLRDGQNALKDLQKVLGEASGRMLSETPSTISEARYLLSVLKFVLTAPPLDGVDIGSEEWLSDGYGLEAVLRAGQRLEELHRIHDGTLKAEAWHQDVLAYRSVLEEYASKWWRRFSRAYRANRKAIDALCQGTPPKDKATTVTLLNSILEAQELVRVIDAYSEQGRTLFGSGWKGVGSDWRRLAETSVWLRKLHAAIRDGGFPATLLDVLSATMISRSLGQLNSSLEDLIAEYVRRVEDTVVAIHLDESRRFGEGRSFTSTSFQQQDETLTLWITEIGRIREMGVLSAVLRRMEECALANAVQAALDWPHASEHMVDLLTQHWLDALLRRALVERPVLATFDGDMHNHHLRKFRELDSRLLTQNRIRLAYEHWKSTPKYQAGGQLGVLYNEFAKKRRHKPIRKLMQEAGRVIQVIKPVFMMSPLSIAMYLPPGSVEFDVVVFDEASQVKPVDAFGAILRARQLVIVGDDRQLPPTTFFETGIDVDDDYSESVTLDLESILGLGLAKGIPSKMLRWHYRSRHESLITVSNHEFYDAKLTVFPSPDKDKRDVGLVYHYLPDTEYGRGGTRKNLAEAKAVAEAVLQHARLSPELTLGVAAFSISQTEAIRDQLEVLRRADASSEPFFRRHPEEPFFVKNLENVQGDERDVILISVGYGRTAEGRISMNFGPLNSDGGERRLNVLITRARRRCEVFTNLRAEDIDLSRTRARGVEVLKRFLKYAESGSLDMPMPSDRDVGSPFEAEVASRLRSKGYRVDHQVGTTGFFIDMAVVDDEAPGRYILGIECDGASYHSARSARDRDRLRQEVLEALGWRLHRIWSTDWFRNPEREFDKLERAIAAARLTLSVGASDGKGSSLASTVTEIARSSPPPRDRTPFEVEQYAKASLRITGFRDNLHEASARRMAEWIEKVVTAESPVHEDEVIRRIADAAGVQRIGNRIEEAFNRGVQAAVRSGMVRKNGPFLWARGKSGVTLRTRTMLPNASRDLSLVAPEEIALAVARVAAASYGMDRGSLAKEVCILFGFARVTGAMVKAVDKMIAKMIKQGELVERGDYLTLPE